MNAILYPLCAAVAWIGLLFKIPALLGRDRGHAAAAVGCFYLFMGLTFTISDPRVWAMIGSASGVPNLALVLSQGCVIGVAASQLAALTFWEDVPERATRRVRGQVIAFGGVLVAMVVLFTLADLTEEDTTTAAMRFAGEGLYSVYLMLYVTAFAVAEYFIAVRCFQYARVVDGRWLRRGLRLAATGAVGGLVYCAVRYADVVAKLVDLDPQRWEFLARLGAGVGGILALVGWSVPGWAPQVRAVRERLRRYRAYRDLYPLWRALLSANPDLALEPNAGRRAVRDLDFRLHRRVIEIRDGIRWLRPYHSADVADAGDAGADDARRAHAEAVTIATALAARAKATVPASPSPTVAVPDPANDGSREETAWLVRVARAFATLETS
ncbi:MAB_1171c family putative transporter [Haloechinothrix halophila]|uniref:MAB_1171c family putative transporter n=1 Tax=Haloechinothrix halophila TaxID=1069073 RepID=UPI000418AE85|nr:MAB_1171c family putative transporter [Haloechinothrix halophila]